MFNADGTGRWDVGQVSENPPRITREPPCLSQRVFVDEAVLRSLCIHHVGNPFRSRELRL